jgi:polysaccharide deacetylase 2 family uncharacterized protein YibQ
MNKLVKKKIIIFGLWFSTCYFLFSSHLQAQGKLAIIVDDIGYNLSQGRKLAQMPLPLTLAVLPFTPHGAELADMGHHHGKEIILHAPMSNEHQLALGPGALTSGISREKLIAVLDSNLANIPHIKGLNNHMGSQLTQDATVMGWLMQYLKERQLYFIDSRTTAKTQALIQAQTIGLSSRKRDVFLDNKIDKTHITQQLNLAIRYARERGSAVAIGHPYPATVAVLQQAESLAQLQGVKLVLTSELLTDTSPSVPLDNYLPGFCPKEISVESIFVTEPFIKLPNSSNKDSLIRY